MSSILSWTNWSSTFYSVAGLGFLFIGAIWSIIKWGHRVTVRAANEVTEPRLQAVEDRMESFEVKLDGVHTQLNRVEKTLKELTVSLKIISEAVATHQGYHEGLKDA